MFSENKKTKSKKRYRGLTEKEEKKKLIVEIFIKFLTEKLFAMTNIDHTKKKLYRFISL